MGLAPRTADRCAVNTSMWSSQEEGDAGMGEGLARGGGAAPALRCINTS
jgi:hypothetical protein